MTEEGEAELTGDLRKLTAAIFDVEGAFTNVGRWNIRRALEVVALSSDRWPEHWAQPSARLDLTAAELRQWLHAADTMATGIDPRTGLFEQFSGFFGLKQIDLAAYAGRSAPMDVALGRERTGRSQVVKQGDVVALLALLPEEFAGATGAKSFRYYEPRCGHGSSLSRAMHWLVAARQGGADMAPRYFHQTSAIDLGDTQVAIAGGVHIASLGGIWLMAIFGFAGLSLRSDGIALDPRLPESRRSLGFSVQWRWRRLKVRIEQAQQFVEATLEAGEPMTLIGNGELHEFRGDRSFRVQAGRALSR